DDLVLVGIKTRGVYLAQRIADRLKQLENAEVPVGQLDITLYRDDRHDASLAQDPVVNEADLGFDIKDKHVILVDDVLFTGRTIRAALDRSEEHTSELQSRFDLVCRLLLVKKIYVNY